MGLPKIPFTPQNASINRVRIVDLPGIEVDDIVAGEQAYNLLSAPAVVKYSLAKANQLKLPQRYLTGNPNRLELRRELPRYIDTCLTSTHTTVRDAATKIATLLGRNLGFLLLTLHRGDAINQQARSDWTSLEWDQWREIQNIYIGGGLVSGHLGDQMIDTASALISTNGFADCLYVKKSHYLRTMAITGASRYLPSHTHHALCLDIGQTSTKAAVVHLDKGVIKGISWLPTQDVVWNWRNDTEAQNEIDPHEVVDFVTRELIRIWHSAYAVGIKLDQDIMVSIAAYVQGGRLLGNGIYARMSLLGKDVRKLLEDRLRYSAGINTKVHIVHDGTAAAAIHAGETNTAVLVLGTAIGVGFAPVSASLLRPISTDLQQITLG